jgi:hypothetical protein
MARSEIFSPENPVVYEIMCKDMVEPERPKRGISQGACAFCVLDK